jgi:flagellar hook-associated protein 2
MAGTTSVSGLVSGLDTATIINQLMSIEAQSQTRLKTRLTEQQSTVKSLQDLNAKIAALGTTAKDLAAGTTLAPLKATSSSTAVVATATTGTAAGSFDVTVVQTAAAHKLTFAATAAPGDHVTGSGTDLVLTTASGPRTLSTDGTLAGVVSALNTAGTGVRATTVRLDDGTQRLVVSAVTSGAASSFTLTAADGTAILGDATVVAGRDAAITIGQDTVHSATNTFTGVVPGLSLTVSAAAVGTTASIEVSSDQSAVTTSLKGLVDAVNASLTTLDALTAFDPTGKASGPLAGDPMVSALRSSLLNSVYPTDGTSLASLGLQTDRSGKLVLDTTKLEAAFASDPATVVAKLGTGFAGRVAAVSTSASDPYDGSLTASVTGQNSDIKRLQDSIEDWDGRLTLRRNTLTQQFTALETALSQMNSQSSWLSSQLGSMSS